MYNQQTTMRFLFKLLIIVTYRRFEAFNIMLRLKFTPFAQNKFKKITQELCVL